MVRIPCDDRPSVKELVTHHFDKRHILCAATCISFIHRRGHRNVLLTFSPRYGSIQIRICMYLAVMSATLPTQLTALPAQLIVLVQPQRRNFLPQSVLPFSCVMFVLCEALFRRPRALPVRASSTRGKSPTESGATLTPIEPPYRFRVRGRAVAMLGERSRGVTSRGVTSRGVARRRSPPDRGPHHAAPDTGVGRAPDHRARVHRRTPRHLVRCVRPRRAVWRVGPTPAESPGRGGARGGGGVWGEKVLSGRGAWRRRGAWGVVWGDSVWSVVHVQGGWWKRSTGRAG